MFEKLIVRKKNGIYALPVNKILYLEKDLRKICIHTQIESVERIEVYSSFDDIMLYLDDRFLFCHRSFIINMDKIVLMADQQVFLEGNEHIFLGRDSFARGKKVFAEYLEKKKRQIRNQD
ncbi:MAG: LytTR family DNA-binding domain-containing protein [Bacillota bacterium]|nr:LytTR family DNA-binding domain-containing protein [Bacillota bacterium]